MAHWRKKSEITQTSSFEICNVQVEKDKDLIYQYSFSISFKRNFPRYSILSFITEVNRCYPIRKCDVFLKRFRWCHLKPVPSLCQSLFEISKDKKKIDWWKYHASLIDDSSDKKLFCWSLVFCKGSNELAGCKVYLRSTLEIQSRFRTIAQANFESLWLYVFFWLVECFVLTLMFVVRTELLENTFTRRANQYIFSALKQVLRRHSHINQNTNITCFWIEFDRSTVGIGKSIQYTIFYIKINDSDRLSRIKLL